MKAVAHVSLKMAHFKTKILAAVTRAKAHPIRAGVAGALFVLASLFVWAGYKELYMAKPEIPTAPAKPAELAGSADSLFIATFNTHLLSPAMCFLDQSHYLKVIPDFTDDCHSEEHATEIADYITKKSPYRDKYEIIALNEVWDEDAKAILVKALAGDGNATVGPYPHYISKLDDDTISIPSDLNLAKAINAEDSGLMLFSRYPFDSLPKKSDVAFTSNNNHFGSPWDDVEGASGVKDKVAFIRFHDCDGVDCIAGKGAGLVRVKKHTRSYSVAFTHLQADSGYEKTRNSQLSAIKHLLDNTLNPPAQRDVFVLGDLNIIGASPEWTSRFSPNSLTTYYRGWDTWWQTSSQADKGATSAYGTGDRLDYHLYNKVLDSPTTDARRLCPQHMRLDFYGLSDHLGVNAHYLTPAPRCSPSLAWQKPPYNQWLLTDPKGDPSELKFMGSTQWFRVEDAGTFSLATMSQKAGTKTWQDGGVSLEVYESTDLTHPVGQYKQMTSEFGVCAPADQVGLVPTGFCRTVTGATFELPKSPFYIKVFHEDDKWHGKYALAIHRHECSSKNDACILHPNADPKDPNWPANKPLNSEDTAWFRIDTEKAFAGKSQDLRFLLANPSGKDAELTLLDGSGTALVNKKSASDAAIASGDISPVDPGLLVGPDTFYLTVKRPLPVNGQFETGLKVAWKTNLSILHGAINGLGGSDDNGKPLSPLLLKVVDETNGAFGNEIGSDEVGLCLVADKTSAGCPVWNKGMDEGEHVNLEGKLQPIGFIDSIKVRFCEADGPVFNDTNCHDKTIGTLTEDKERSWAQKSEAHFEGGIWRLYYNLSRYLTK